MLPPDGEPADPAPNPAPNPAQDAAPNSAATSADVPTPAETSGASGKTEVRPEDVARVAHLARLGLEPEEQQSMLSDLMSILEHFEILQQVDTTGVAPLSHPLGTLGKPAEDQVAVFPDPRRNLVTLTEHAREGFFVVPRVLDDSEPS